MKAAIINPSPLSGAVSPPPSKSVAHRAVICAALANGRSRLSPAMTSDDISATIGALRSLGAVIEEDSSSVVIMGKGQLPIREAAVDCHESGSTLRFLIPVAAAGGGVFTFSGSGRLPQRPLGPYLSCLPDAGVTCEASGGLPLKLSGTLCSGDFTLPGNVSSQFITGLLLALPLLPGDSRIILSSPLESSGYTELTSSVMARFGVRVGRCRDGFYIPGKQTYSPCDLSIEGDWSQAAFWLAAGALGGYTICEGLAHDSLQGDRTIAALLGGFGADIRCGENSVSARGRPLSGIRICAKDIPDLVPVLAAVACFAEGRTVIEGAGRLRLKESDRLRAITQGLRSLGGRITETEDGLIIEGGRMTGGEADGAGDHRIVMALCIAASYCTGKSRITGCECIAKSYPEFFEDFIQIGGDAVVFDMG